MTEPNCVGPKGNLINCGNTFLTGDDAKADQVVLTLPLGLSTSGLPVGGNFAGEQWFLNGRLPAQTAALLACLPCKQADVVVCSWVLPLAMRVCCILGLQY